MNYDEEVFKKSANKKAMVMWLTLCLVLSGAYAIEIVKGLRTVSYYITFLMVCWIPFFVGLLVFKIKGMATPVYKYIVFGCYSVFYAFVLVTTTSTLAFVYILPLACMLVLYKDRKFVLISAVVTLLIQIMSIVRNFVLGMNAASDITSYEIQLAATVLCYMGYLLSLNHLIHSDSAMLESVKGNLDRVVKTVEQVKDASNEVVNGVNVVRELTDENREDAGSVVQSTEELSGNNGILREKTLSSMDMTAEINEQVQNVAGLITEMVGLIGHSETNSRNSSTELAEVVNSTDGLAELSDQVSTILTDFKAQFEMVKQETGTIEDITSQTNLLSLNASIEAARAGEAGKGFAVVAGEIQSLSVGTQNSSNRILEAMDHLEAISAKMTNSITEMIALITETREKINAVSESVSAITSDSGQLGSNIQVIDSAMKEVENSNQSMVENMKQICDVMEIMTNSVEHAGTATRTMLSKYEETASNMENIEEVVGELMKKLGTGGFMQSEDIKAGMKMSLTVEGNPKQEVRGEVVEVNGHELTVKLPPADPQTEALQKQKGVSVTLMVVVENVLYRWEDIRLKPAKHRDPGCFVLTVDTNPSVLNRRRHPRLPVTYGCTITSSQRDLKIEGRMVNISAGGFAFASGDQRILQCKNRAVQLEIHDFPLPECSLLEGIVIRVTESQGKYIAGCRMPEDHSLIEKYVADAIAHNNENGRS